jgi:hypothetical protein
MKVVVTAFKTEGFGAIGSLTEVSHDGINDIADDGSICIDSELQVRKLLNQMHGSFSYLKKVLLIPIKNKIPI